MKQLILFFLIISSITYVELSLANSDNFNEQFNIAVQSYNNKDYKNAEQLFLNLLRQEPQSPEILQNLGLIYYAQEDRGRALAYFRSLINIEPRNIVTYKTIDFIESKLTNKDFDHDRSFFEDVDLMVLRWIKLPEFLIIHFLCLFVFGIVFIKRWATKKKVALQDEKIILFTPQIYAGSIFLLLLTCLVLLKISFDNTDKATIIAKNKLTIKSGPSENSADLYELFEGFEVNVESTFNDWVQITYQNQYTGWVKNNNIWKHLK
jgi:tetratricopeptide (TPR) repeat protein